MTILQTWGFVNYYGPQRFGSSQKVQADQVGLELLKDDMVMTIQFMRSVCPLCVCIVYIKSTHTHTPVTIAMLNLKWNQSHLFWSRVYHTYFGASQICQFYSMLPCKKKNPTTPDLLNCAVISYAQPSSSNSTWFPQSQLKRSRPIHDTTTTMLHHAYGGVCMISCLFVVVVAPVVSFRILLWSTQTITRFVTWFGVI